VVQLSTFELVTSNIYAQLEAAGLSEAVAPYRIVVTFAAALTAAILSSLASQPGDTLLSAVNKSAKAAISSDGGSSVSSGGTLAIMKDTLASVGVQGLFVGTKARLLHVGVIVVIQLLAYDIIKAACGIPVTGMSGGH